MDRGPQFPSRLKELSNPIQPARNNALDGAIAYLGFPLTIQNILKQLVHMFTYKITKMNQPQQVYFAQRVVIYQSCIKYMS